MFMWKILLFSLISSNCGGIPWQAQYCLLNLVLNNSIDLELILSSISRHRTSILIYAWINGCLFLGGGGPIICKETAEGMLPNLSTHTDIQRFKVKMCTWFTTLISWTLKAELELIYIHIAQYHDWLYSLYSIQRPVSLDRGSDMEALPPKKLEATSARSTGLTQDRRTCDKWCVYK